MEDESTTRIKKEHMEHLRRNPLRDSSAAEIFKGTDFDKRNDNGVVAAENKDPFSTPPRTPGGQESTRNSSHAASYRSQAGEAFASVGVNAPCE
jgi:hypothetical protein